MKRNPPRVKQRPMKLQGSPGPVDTKSQTKKRIHEGTPEKKAVTQSVGQSGTPADKSRKKEDESQVSWMYDTPHTQNTHISEVSKEEEARDKRGEGLAIQAGLKKGSKKKKSKGRKSQAEEIQATVVEPKVDEGAKVASGATPLVQQGQSGTALMVQQSAARVRGDVDDPMVQQSGGAQAPSSMVQAGTLVEQASSMVQQNEQASVSMVPEEQAGSSMVHQTPSSVVHAKQTASPLQAVAQAKQTADGQVASSMVQAKQAASPLQAVKQTSSMVQQSESRSQAPVAGVPDERAGSSVGHQAESPVVQLSSEQDEAAPGARAETKAQGKLETPQAVTGTAKESESVRNLVPPTVVGEQQDGNQAVGTRRMGSEQQTAMLQVARVQSVKQGKGGGTLVANEDLEEWDGCIKGLCRQRMKG